MDTKPLLREACLLSADGHIREALSKVREAIAIDGPAPILATLSFLEADLESLMIRLQNKIEENRTNA